MPIQLSRALTGRERTRDANQKLGLVLAFVAGAVNAGGFLAVQQYTSHMTGVVSSMADYLALGDYALVGAGFGALLSFMLGAATCAVVVNFSRRRGLHSEFALPLFLEAGLLLVFGLLGARWTGIDALFVPVTVALLCFIMGLQNALITKVSQAEIRTTHVTGLVTDLGIELGKMAYWNAPGADEPVRSNRARVKLLAGLLACFFIGGVAGALGFKHVGFGAVVPLALALMALVAAPAWDDLLALRRSPH